MKLCSYIASVYDVACTASFSRWASTATISTGCYALIYLVCLNHALPGPADLVALSVWMTSPYGINKIATAFTKPGDDSGSAGDTKPAA